MTKLVGAIDKGIGIADSLTEVVQAVSATAGVEINEGSGRQDGFLKKEGSWLDAAKDKIKGWISDGGDFFIGIEDDRCAVSAAIVGTAMTGYHFLQGDGPFDAADKDVEYAEITEKTCTGAAF